MAVYKNHLYSGGRAAERRTNQPEPLPIVIRTALSLALLLAASILAPAPALAQSAGGGDTVSVLEGVYLEEQATFGRTVFDRECMFCHATEEFTGTRFRLTWVGRPLSSLHALISLSMPMDRPGALAPDEYAALVAYLLRLNGYPEGDVALPVETESLQRIMIESPGGSR